MMKPTIRTKLVAGFSAVLVLLAAASALGAYTVFSLGRTRVAARLNAVALEIQVHNLEAERRVAKYLAPTTTAAAKKSGDAYLEEASFEIHEMQSLVEQAANLATTGEMQSVFGKMSVAEKHYERQLAKAVEAHKSGAQSDEARAAVAEYQDAAEDLREKAEDGEAVAKDASQSSMESIDRTSNRLVAVVICIGLAGLLLGGIVSYKLSRAILVPVQHLKDVAESVSLGNLDVAVRRYSDDEIGDLADSFSRMVTALKFYRMEAAMSELEAEADAKLSVAPAVERGAQ